MCMKKEISLKTNSETVKGFQTISNKFKFFSISSTISYETMSRERN